MFFAMKKFRKKHWENMGGLQTQDYFVFLFLKPEVDFKSLLVSFFSFLNGPCGSWRILEAENSPLDLPKLPSPAVKCQVSLSRMLQRAKLYEQISAHSYQTELCIIFLSVHNTKKGSRFIPSDRRCMKKSRGLTDNALPKFAHFSLAASLERLWTGITVSRV